MPETMQHLLHPPKTSPTRSLCAALSSRKRVHNADEFMAEIVAKRLV